MENAIEMAVQHHISVEKTARYHQLGELDESTEQVWVVLHGYGQLSAYFIRNFNGLIGQGTAVIAPEGLSRFYQKGHEGRVGATWMTKDDRLVDISDNLCYLDRLMDRIVSIAPKAKVSMLGFSQGAATMVRWFAANYLYPIDRLVIWAGVMPPEISIDELTGKHSETKMHLVYGENDELQSEEFRQRLTELKASGKFIITSFEGGHEIDARTLGMVAGEI